MATDESTLGLRLWPGVLAVVLQWLAWLVAPLVIPSDIGGYVTGAGLLLGGLAVVTWWSFLSRAPRGERWGAVALIVVAMVATPPFLHESVARGNLGLQFYAYAIPVLCLAFVVWAVASRFLSPTSCSFATARRWPHSGCPPRQVDRSSFACREGASHC